MVNLEMITTTDKGRIAEAAVLFRLALVGLSPLRSVFEGDSYDWLVDNGDRVVKIQVKWALRYRYGQPCVPLTTSKREGRYRYTPRDFDFLVGYELLSDEAHIFTWEDIGDNTSVVAFKPSTREAWHRIRA